MIKYIKIVLFGYLAVISINIAQVDQIDIRSVNISGMSLLRKRVNATFKTKAFDFFYF